MTLIYLQERERYTIFGAVAMFFSGGFSSTASILFQFSLKMFHLMRQVLVFPMDLPPKEVCKFSMLRCHGEKPAWKVAGEFSNSTAMYREGGLFQMAVVFFFFPAGELFQ